MNPLRASTKILWNTQTRVRRWISASASASCAMFSLSPKVLASYDESVVRGVRVRSRNLICWHSAVVLPLNGNVRNPRYRNTNSLFLSLSLGVPPSELFRPFRSSSIETASTSLSHPIAFSFSLSTFHLCVPQQPSDTAAIAPADLTTPTH